MIVFGIWDHNWDSDELIALFVLRKDAEVFMEEADARAKGTKRRRPAHYWQIEEHQLRGGPA